MGFFSFGLPFNLQEITTTMISPLRVLHSNAGYYFGTTWRADGEPFDMPNSRDSGYYATKEEATRALKSYLECVTD